MRESKISMNELSNKNRKILEKINLTVNQKGKTMKTGEFAYWDGTIDAKFDKKRPLKGIVVVEDDCHAFLVLPKEIKEVDWWDGKRKCEEQFAQMPNLRQCKAIYDNKGVLNKSLVAAGFATIDGEAIWSSTEYTSSYAWKVGMNYGSRYINDKTNGYYVRPVRFLGVREAM